MSGSTEKLLMKAIITTKYGSPDVLKFKEVEKPEPSKTQALVKVYAATVIAGDCELRRLSFPFFFRLLIRLAFGIRAPRNKIFGQELAGEIESVGSEVTRFKKGDQIFATTGLGLGAYAEFKCLSETANMSIKPTNMSFEQAATIGVGGTSALHFLRQVNLRVGQKVLINGAGGSIGTIAIQLAKLWGAEVTAVDRSEKIEMLRSLGADKVIDYTHHDFTKLGETYDVVFDIVGKSSYSRSLKVVKPSGYYVLGNPEIHQYFRARWTSKRSGKKVITKPAPDRKEDLEFLTKLIEEGKLTTFIDRSYPLEQIAEAHRYVETGLKQGNVVINVHQGRKTHLEELE